MVEPCGVMTRRTRTFLAAAMLASSFGALTVARAALPECAVPQLSAPPFAGDGRNQIVWFQPTDQTQGGGFQIEVAFDPQTAAGGEFVSLVDSQVNVIRSIPAGPDDRSILIEDLPERTLFYHVRVKASANNCTVPLNPWSNIVSTTQDYTGPRVTMRAQNSGVYALGSVIVEGTAEDLPADGAEIASGADSVDIVMDNTTPLLGTFNGDQTVDVADDGTWTATFEDVPLGTYNLTATGKDAVGNESRTSPRISIIVVSTP